MTVWIHKHFASTPVAKHPGHGDQAVHSPKKGPGAATPRSEQVGDTEGAMSALDSLEERAGQLAGERAYGPNPGGMRTSEMDGAANHAYGAYEGGREIVGAANRGAADASMAKLKYKYSPMGPPNTRSGQIRAGKWAGAQKIYEARFGERYTAP